MTDPAHRGRVVLLCLDGFNHASVTPETTPCLWSLRDRGGWAPTGGRCDLPAVTYVSHATLATGTFPASHGVTSNLAAAPRPGAVPGWAGESRVRTPTLFGAFRDAGLASVAILGDQHLVGIMEANRAEIIWPPGGVLPDETPLCPAGYAMNSAVRGHLLDAVERTDLSFIFGHLNETDTWGHGLGPDHAETRRAEQDADTIVGEVVHRLGADWERTVLIVVSDHGMETVTRAEPIDLMADPDVRATIAEVVPEGGVALAKVRDSVRDEDAGAAMGHGPGVVSWRQLRPGVLLVIGEAGRVFGSAPSKHLRGVHGGPGTTTTLALVAGGHPAVPGLATAIDARPPHLADWAPTIAALCGVPFPSAEGQNLLG